MTNTIPAEAKPVLHVLNLGTNVDVAIPNATGGTFSPDSRWMAYQVDPSPGRRERENAASSDAGAAPGGPQGRGGPPAPPRRAEVRNLSTGVVQAWQDIQSFTFSPASTHVILRRRPPTPPGAGRGGGAGGATGGAPAAPGAPGGGSPNAGGTATDAPAGPRGADVILLDLTTGRHQLLGSVGDIAFNKTGDLLAYTVDSPVKDANGLFVFDARNGRTTPLDNDARTYNRLAWSEESSALAVLKGAEVEKMRERDNTLIVFPDVAAALANTTAPPKPVTLDPARVGTFPAGWVVSDRAALTWSEDGTRVFFGIKEQVAAPRPPATRPNRDEAADVDVWNTVDERIQSVQMIRAEADRNFTYRQAFDVSAARFVKLADQTLRDLDVAKDGRWAVGRDTRGYVHDHKRPAADIYRVNTSTGERTLMLKNQLIGNHILGISSDSRHFLYWKENKYQAYDLDAGTAKTLGNGSSVSFVDMEFDRPGPRPSYGIAGYTSDGKGVIVHQRYDLWLLPLDGSAPSNLTNGTGSRNEIRFRYVRTEPADAPAPGDGAARPGGGGPNAPREPIDLSRPLTLSAYGEYTKKAGFYELTNGQLKELVYEDASFGTPAKAKKAEKFLFTRQTFVEFPNLRVSGSGFTDAKTITDANPQQAEYAWGRRILFDYKNRDGVRLQGMFITLVSLRGIAGFYTDYLWFDEVGLTERLAGRARGQDRAWRSCSPSSSSPIMWANLTIADRLAPTLPARWARRRSSSSATTRSVGPRAGLVRIGVPPLFALIAGPGAAGQWNAWILFRNQRALRRQATPSSAATSASTSSSCRS